MSEEVAAATAPTHGVSAGDFDFADAKVAFASSTIATRLAQLKSVDERISRGSLDQPSTTAVLRLLIWTHDAYRDRASRRAVQHCLESLCKVAVQSNNGDKLVPLVAALRHECGKDAAAVTSIFVLVEWCSLLMLNLVDSPDLWAKLGDDIVLATADGLEKCRHPAAKQSVGRSAMVVTRRGFRKLATCESKETVVKRAVYVLTAKGSQPTAKHAILLGLIAGVCARKLEARPILQGFRSEYLTFYTREVVGSRAPLPEHVAQGLNDFFCAFVSLDDLEREVLPVLEKGLLRAPEVVLDLIAPLVRALPEEIDLSTALTSRLLKPLLSNVKSSNAAIRNGAVAAFKTMLACRCRDTAVLEDKVVDEILGPLKTNKLASADHRVLHAEMLAALPRTVGVASKIANGLPAITAKEGNETALAAETLTLNASAEVLLSGEGGEQVPKALTDTYVNGLAEKKLPVRRIWVLRAGELLHGMLNSLSAIPPNLIEFSESMLPQMLATFNEVVANPLAASQNGLVTGALVLCALHAVFQRPETPDSLSGLMKRASVQRTSLMFDPKPSFLLNPRIYSRLTDEDLRWLYRALSSVASGLRSCEEPARTAWAQAFIFLACSSGTPHKIREEASSALSDLYVQSRAIAKDGPSTVSEALIQGIWHWIDALEASDKESAAALAKSGTENLNLVLRCICLTPKDCEERAAALGVTGGSLDPTQLETQMCSILVLTRPDLVPRAKWIDLCLKVKLDPGELARKYEKRLVEEIVERSSYRQKSHAVKKAAYSAAAELVFVAPETMTNTIVSLIQQDLATAEVQNIGPLEAAIFRTPEGTAFVDVLAKKRDVVPNKNTKDYSIVQWEEDLRGQLAKKKGIQKKLTADETAKVNAQIKKEAAIRDNVRHIEARILRGFGVVQGLATGPPTDTASWIGPAVRAMLDVIDAGACLITGEVGPMTYISLSDRISSRLGPLRPFVGVATLRAQSHSNASVAAASLPEHMMQEPVADLVTRVLYRLRFAGEQRPFDTVSLIYILPLVLMVIRNGGFGTEGGKTSSNPDESPNDEKDTQLVLAIELLAFHTDGCADETIPRAEVLETLIFAMQHFKQHYKIIRDCLADMVRCIAPVNMTADETSVLAHGAIVPEESVRTAILQAISSEVDMGEMRGTVCEELIWLACHDHVDQNADLGHEIWDESDFIVTEDMPHKLLTYLESKDAQLRVAAAKALAKACILHPSTIESVLAKLRELYPKLAKPRVPELDQFGMPKKMDLSDPWQARHGIAAAFEELAAHLQKDQLDPFFTFLIERGPLRDQNAGVRAKMLDAANAAIEVHGKVILDRLMKTFERTLEAPDSGSQAGDRVNEAVIIMYGALARHLEPGDIKIPVVIERLLATLSTPSETVQYAIAECLPPLVRSCGDKSSKYFDQIMETLLTSTKYSAQRGAAYGLAGLVHGRGIAALREYHLLISLRSALENKKESNQREAALLAFELLATALGRLFEPYAIQIVPQLLQGFGDSNGDVREAALAAAKACFARLSSYGVKKILPTLLNGLDEDQWRSKKGACDLLGAMAYLDPQQLAQSLPEIIPPLTAVLTDSHKEVRIAANKSLRRFGEVITNPEIHGLVDILLKALSDPTKYTDDALDSLIKVHFVHYLDAPSLALVTRILQRGLGDRSNTKRKSAQVIGSLAHLTERKDLVSHLPVLVAGLKGAIVDPVPTTRATASRALGSLIEKLGEDAMPDLIPGLMHTLRTETGAGDRLGSAQALSEVLAGLGTSRLEETLPTILQNVESAKPSVREGFMTLFIFLPVCFGNSFANYLARIIPPILSGLADEVESIRDTALRAGRLLVKNFAVRAVDLLLPELERGVADDSYRIRLSSVELVGDLLFNLTGVKSSDAEDDEDEEEQKEPAREAGASLREILGEEKRNNVLSALYICRCDTSGMVRAAAIAVWKALVPSPRVLKELVPTLTQLIIRRLGSTNMEHKVIASNALGEMIRKAGDGVLSTLLPTLEEGLQSSSDTDAKQGICLALKELIASASEEALEEHEKTLISVVRTALTDSDAEVREAAAEAFDSLQQILGKRAVDQVLPFLLNMLRSSSSGDASTALGGEANNALAALLTMLTETTRSNMILPNLIPTLIASPISTFNARALASLCRVAGAAMNRRLPSIINSLMDNMINGKDSGADREALAESFDIVILSINDNEGLNQVMNVLLQLTKHKDHRKRAATARALARFFAVSEKSSSVDYSRYHQDIVRALLISFDDYDTEVVQAAWSALSEFTKKLHKEDLEPLVVSTRQTLQQVGVAGHNLKGFELPKGISAVLPIFLQGLMNGTSEQRVAAALGIADVVDRTSEAALRPFVTQMTGPLIRVVSERSTEVRAAVLLTLNRLLDKIPAALRPFLPQLQRTFAKALADPSSELLRQRAARALGTLIKHAPRVDPLLAELVTGVRAAADQGVRTAMLRALYEVVSTAGKGMGDGARQGVLGLIADHGLAGGGGAEDGPDGAADGARSSAGATGGGDMAVNYARLFGALVGNVPLEVTASLLKSRVMVMPATPASVLAMNAVLKESPSVLLESALAEDLPEVLRIGMGSRNPFVADNSVVAAGKYLLSRHGEPKPYDTTKPLYQTLAAMIQPVSPLGGGGGGVSPDTRRLALVVIRLAARLRADATRAHLAALGPAVFAAVRDPIIPVKLAAESAFVELFAVADEESRVFDKWMGPGGGGAELVAGNASLKRTMTDYFRRVAMRIGGGLRERREREGLGLGTHGSGAEEAEALLGAVLPLDDDDARKDKGMGLLLLAPEEVEDLGEVTAVGRVDDGKYLFGAE